MSDNNRERALAAALQVGGTSPAEIIGKANVFLAFLNGDKALDAPKAEKSATPAAKKEPAVATTVATEPVTPKKTAGATKPATPAASASPSEGATEEQVGKAIGAMLEANKKAEAIALLGKFGAKSKSTLAEEHYAAFVAGAEEILLS
jgi:hypothetical protein